MANIGATLQRRAGFILLSQGIPKQNSQLPVTTQFCVNCQRQYHRIISSGNVSRTSTNCLLTLKPPQIRDRKCYPVLIQSRRNQHTNRNNSVPKPKTETKKKGLVYVSSSADTYANLAFEDWVHDNWDLSDLNVLFLWRNEPSIVIGRHQNPWTECNIRELLTKMPSVKLARRRSGGGTVYHDLGNVNCTFFTDRKSYDRKGNLQIMVDGLTDAWPHLDINISPRDDLVLNNFYKISGTAAKLSRNIAYHHCTLLHSVNTRALSSLLNFDADGVKSNATESVRSPVLNLQDADPRLSQEDVFDAIAQEFYSKNPPCMKNKIYAVSPTDETTWKGITGKKKELMDWHWIYGKTPKFHVKKQQGDLAAVVHVEKGLIEGIVVHMPYGHVDTLLVQQLTSALKGVRFWIPDVAMAIHIFLNESGLDEDDVKELEPLRQLIEDCIS